jgi:hypothetical protein
VCVTDQQVTERKSIDDLVKSSAATRVGAISVQQSHDDAAVMLQSAERALDQLLMGLSNGTAATPPAPLAAPVVDEIQLKRVRRQRMGVLAASLCLVGMVLTFVLQTPDSSASGGTTALPIAELQAEGVTSPITAAEIEAAHKNSADIGSRMYAAEFARTDALNMRCLAEAVYFEARGEPYAGQILLRKSFSIGRVRDGGRAVFAASSIKALIEVKSANSHTSVALSDRSRSVPCGTGHKKLRVTQRSAAPGCANSCKQRTIIPSPYRRSGVSVLNHFKRSGRTCFIAVRISSLRSRCRAQETRA